MDIYVCVYSSQQMDESKFRIHQWLNDGQKGLAHKLSLALDPAKNLTE